ncbi:MAG: hypothetical protein AB7U23_13105 [Dehalococcoidia bacterium]
MSEPEDIVDACKRALPGVDWRPAGKGAAVGRYHWLDLHARRDGGQWRVTAACGERMRTRRNDDLHAAADYLLIAFDIGWTEATE